MTDADRRSRRFDDWSESSNDRRDFEFGSGMKHEDSLTFLVNDIKVLTRVGDYSWSRVLNLLVLLGLHLQHACKYDFCKMITHTQSNERPWGAELSRKDLSHVGKTMLFIAKIRKDATCSWVFSFERR
jgi:hypothetical protein